MKTFKIKLLSLLILSLLCSCNGNKKKKELIDGIVEEEGIQDPIVVEELENLNPKGVVDHYVTAVGGECDRSPAATEEVEIIEVIEEDDPADIPVLSSERAPGCIHEKYNSKKILYIGDSHSVLSSETASPKLFGHVLSEGLKACSGADLNYQASCGSRPSKWSNAQTSVSSSCGMTAMTSEGFVKDAKSVANFPSLVAGYRPDHVIINLGDNMFSWEADDKHKVGSVGSKDLLIKEVQNMMDQIPTGATCEWIGPTYSKPGKAAAQGTSDRDKFYRKDNSVVDEMYAVIAAGISGKCSLIDSRSFFDSSTMPQNDGLHLYKEVSGSWANKVIESIQSN